MDMDSQSVVARLLHMARVRSHVSQGIPPSGDVALSCDAADVLPESVTVIPVSQCSLSSASNDPSQRTLQGRSCGQ